MTYDELLALQQHRTTYEDWAAARTYEARRAANAPLTPEEREIQRETDERAAMSRARMNRQYDPAYFDRDRSTAPTDIESVYAAADRIRVEMES
jgi:hypothetical protein